MLYHFASEIVVFVVAMGNIFRNDDSHFCVTLFRIFEDENSIIFQLFSTYSHTSGNTKIWAKTLINCVWKYTKDMH